MTCVICGGPQHGPAAKLWRHGTNGSYRVAPHVYDAGERRSYTRRAEDRLGYTGPERRLVDRRQQERRQ